MKYVRKTHKHTAHNVREYVAFHEHQEVYEYIICLYIRPSLSACWGSNHSPQCLQAKHLSLY